MNVLLCSIGRRGYIADYFRSTDPPCVSITGTTDRHSVDSEFTVGLSACDYRYCVPSVADDSYIDSILRICEEREIDILCSLLDVDNHELSRHLPRFRAMGVIPFISSFEVNDICLDKYRTYEFLKNTGFCTPGTYLSVEEFVAADGGFPVVVKARRGCASERLTVVNGLAALESFFEPDMDVIQQLVRGDEYSFDIFNDLDGRTLSLVVKKKLRMRAGETDQAITVRDDRLAEYAARIGTELGHVGPLDVDLLVWGDDIAVIDFNPRFGGGYPLSHAAGADFPQLMVDICAGQPVGAQPDAYKPDVVMLKDAVARVFSLDELSAMPRRL